MKADVAVQCVEAQLRAALANTAGLEAVAAVDKFAIPLLALAHGHGHWRHVEIAIDLPVESLEPQIGREFGLKIEIQLAVYALEAGRAGGVLCEANRNGPVHSVDLPGS